MSSADTLIKSEIIRALEDAEKEKQSLKVQYNEAVKNVKDLNKSVKCKHSFDDGWVGMQIGCDICSKCGWEHVW